MQRLTASTRAPLKHEVKDLVGTAERDGYPNLDTGDEPIVGRFIFKNIHHP
jgi:hypothetical protein